MSDLSVVLEKPPCMPELFDHALFLQQLVNRVKEIEEELQRLRQSKADIAQLQPLRTIEEEVHQLQHGKADVAHVTELSKLLTAKASAAQVQELRDDAHVTFEKLQELQRVKTDASVVQKLSIVVQDNAAVVQRLSSALQDKVGSDQLNVVLLQLKEVTEVVQTKADLAQSSMETLTDSLLGRIQDLAMSHDESKKVTTRQLMEIEDFAVQQLGELNKKLESKASADLLTELQSDVAGMGELQLKEFRQFHEALQSKATLREIEELQQVVEKTTVQEIEELKKNMADFSQVQELTNSVQKATAAQVKGLTDAVRKKANLDQVQEMQKSMREMSDSLSKVVTSAQFQTLTEIVRGKASMEKLQEVQSSKVSLSQLGLLAESFQKLQEAQGQLALAYKSDAVQLQQLDVTVKSLQESQKSKANASELQQLCDLIAGEVTKDQGRIDRLAQEMRDSLQEMKTNQLDPVRVTIKDLQESQQSKANASDLQQLCDWIAGELTKDNGRIDAKADVSQINELREMIEKASQFNTSELNEVKSSKADNSELMNINTQLTSLIDVLHGMASCEQLDDVKTRVSQVEDQSRFDAETIELIQTRMAALSAIVDSKPGAEMIQQLSEVMQEQNVNIRVLQNDKADVAQLQQLTKRTQENITSQLKDFADLLHVTSSQVEQLQSCMVDTRQLQEMENMFTDLMSAIQDKLQAKQVHLETMADQIKDLLDHNVDARHLQDQLQDLQRSIRNKATCQQVHEILDMVQSKINITQFEELLEQVQEKASVKQVTELQRSKAGAAELEELGLVLKSKATQAQVQELSNIVKGKVTQAQVQELMETLSPRRSESGGTIPLEEISGQLHRLDAHLQTKADATQLNQLAKEVHGKASIEQLQECASSLQLEELASVVEELMVATRIQDEPGSTGSPGSTGGVQFKGSLR